MSALTPNIILQRLPNLHVQIDSSNQVQVLLPGKRIPCGQQGLAVLEAFVQPTSLGELLKTLSEWEFCSPRAARH